MRFIIIIMIFFVSCTQSQKRPNYISFQKQNDSILVYVKNSLGCPTNLETTILTTQQSFILDLKPYESKKVFSFLEKNIDTLKILKDHNFKMKYGSSNPLKKYDSLYNYALPFLKGKRYKILQGQNTNFTHKGALSKYAIDFKMNIGQTICAMKDGIVVAIKEDSNRGGRSKKYYKDANYIMMYHNDGLFTQYVHLKQNGALVKIGDSIKKNMPIGYSGNTGMSTEPHLHFGVFKTTLNGFISIPYLLDSIPTQKYVKGKYAFKN